MTTLGLAAPFSIEFVCYNRFHLTRRVMKDQCIPFDDVRSEGKLMMSMLQGWNLVVHAGAEDLRAQSHESYIDEESLPAR